MPFPDYNDIFTQDSAFDLGQGSLFVQMDETQGNPFPPAPGNFELLDGTFFLLLDGTNLLLL